jgi:ribonuclease HII
MIFQGNVDVSSYRNIAGIDEVGRGTLCGAVVAAVVILPPGFSDPRIKDSKLIKSAKKREEIAKFIKENAIAWGIGASSPQEIDRINILQATFLAMKRAIDSCSKTPDFLYVDGDRFNGYGDIPYECVVKGDSKVLSIAAASIIAKVHRDDLMKELHNEFPKYSWNTNVGYGTADHIKTIREIGITKHHRMTFCQNFI